MNEKPENFVITFRGDTAHVERNFEFAKDEIRLQIAVRSPDVTNMSLRQLHHASLEIAIQHLQNLLAQSKAEAAAEK